MTNAPGTVTAPAGLDFALLQDSSLRVTWRGRELFRYVYRPRESQVESPRPYLHPIRTLGGRLVTIYRPHDHVWHKGLSLALSNAGPDNFWGGPTYLRSLGGYTQLPNNGSQRHERFEVLNAGDRTLRCVQRLRWTTRDGRDVLAERRGLAVTVLPFRSAWRLDFSTALHNVGGEDIEISSPQTEGRDGAAYSGLFWRGPRSFSGGTVRTPDAQGGDELNGARAPWLAFTGRHDGDGSASTLLFVDDPGNPTHPTAWFVRSEVYAVVCPAPFAEGVLRLDAGAELRLRYAVIVADGDLDADACAALARPDDGAPAERDSAP
ncbi:PmoA family protein [Dactylosporangium sp. NPDC048998]|uniref:DUF6807 domain-containing protein n=1 Tax=Dactylosporangium sp. NPDC048998 TaxID=3363976 RepID=UPI00371709C5